MTDIETALAEALQLIAKYEHGSPWKWWTPREDCVGSSAEFAAAILATEPMQAMARQAALGAAVESMSTDRYWAIEHVPMADLKAGVQTGWAWRATRPDGDLFYGDTLPEAVAAAVEDDR